MIGIDWDSRARAHARPSRRPGCRFATRAAPCSRRSAPSSPRKSDVSAQHLSGSVGIIRVYYSLFQDKYGWLLVLWFSVVLNVNLAILNLLPFPVLDGGHITTGASSKPSAAARSTSACSRSSRPPASLMLLGFMVFVSFYDTGDSSAPARSRGRRAKKVELRKDPGRPAEVPRARSASRASNRPPCPPIRAPLLPDLYHYAAPRDPRGAWSARSASAATIPSACSPCSPATRWTPRRACSRRSNSSRSAARSCASPRRR